MEGSLREWLSATEAGSAKRIFGFYCMCVGVRGRVGGRAAWELAMWSWGAIDTRAVCVRVFLGCKGEATCSSKLPHILRARMVTLTACSASLAPWAVLLSVPVCLKRGQALTDAHAALPQGRSGGAGNSAGPPCTALHPDHTF